MSGNDKPPVDSMTIAMMEFELQISAEFKAKFLACLAAVFKTRDDVRYYYEETLRSALWAQGWNQEPDLLGETSDHE